MKHQIIIGGFGGQGVMLAGTLLCHSAMKEGKEVTFFPSYGAEMRGGTANCQVIVSDEPIGSPVFSSPDILLAFNSPSYKRFSVVLREEGLALINTSLITPEENKKINIVGIPASRISDDCGSPLALNMVMLGGLVCRTGIVKLDTLQDSVGEILTERKRNLWEINKKAVLSGFSFLEEKGTR
jgi:2-oxoglutarate ferredoxin oxidoreductase subunit gamma